MNILRQKLPNDVLFNFGKNGDTVHGLYKRLTKITFPNNIHLGFIWIGTNDILVQRSTTYALYKKISKKPWKTYQKQFQQEYQKILNSTTEKIPKIITIPPVLIGEDISNHWNQELGEMTDLIKTISQTYSSVEFLDVRDSFITFLAAQKQSTYLLKNATSVLFDKLIYTTAADIDLCAQKRGLHLTLDGVHFNSRGAKMVADIFFTAIQKYRTNMQNTSSETSIEC